MSRTCLCNLFSVRKGYRPLPKGWLQWVLNIELSGYHDRFTERKKKKRQKSKHSLPPLPFYKRLVGTWGVGLRSIKDCHGEWRWQHMLKKGGGEPKPEHWADPWEKSVQPLMFLEITLPWFCQIQLQVHTVAPQTLQIGFSFRIYLSLANLHSQVNILTLDTLEGNVYIKILPLLNGN